MPKVPYFGPEAKSTEVTLEIGAGEKRTRWVEPTYSEEARSIDVECLEILGEGSVEIQLIRGDIPQASFRMHSYTHSGEFPGVLSCRGMVVPARQGWWLVASREAPGNQPSIVKLRITQRRI